MAAIPKTKEIIPSDMPAKTSGSPGPSGRRFPRPANKRTPPPKVPKKKARSFGHWPDVLIADWSNMLEGVRKHGG